MKRTENQFRITMEILREYKRREPFHLYLREAFKKRRSGSSDRRFIRMLCYAALRVRKGLPKTNTDRQILIGLLLTEPVFSEEIKHLLKLHGEDGWDALDAFSIEERKEKLKEVINPERIFPLMDRISRQIDRKAFIHSHLVQPLTWIRVKENYLHSILNSLKKAELVPKRYPGINNAIGLEPSVNLELVLTDNNYQYEVQDLSSQRTIHDLNIKAGSTIWDCCAGSGGKTLALVANQPNFEIYVSDNRFPILKNLDKRFRASGVKEYNSSLIDLTENKNDLTFKASRSEKVMKIKSGKFDLILADVPCSGSGTWGRSPEWLIKYRSDELSKNVLLQRKILSGALKFLKVGGELVYITCSVYEQENEQIVKWLEQEFSLNLLKMEYFYGYENRADTMFMARLKK